MSFTLLHSHWQLHQATATSATGPAISSPTFAADGWTDAVVPGTVLTSLLRDRRWLRQHVSTEVLALPANQQHFDPCWARNNLALPDLGDRALRDAAFTKGRGREFYTYWFRTQFSLSEEQRHAPRLWLEFRGINYRATVFLNGEQLPATPTAGMFLRHSFDITHLAHREGENGLAVLVEPLDHPGICNQINGSDGDIGRNVSMQYLAGWDWVPAIADRNTGIWDRVELHATGVIRLRDPQVITRVPGVRTAEADQAPALVTVHVDVENTDTEAHRVTVTARLGALRVSQEVLAAPGRRCRVSFSPEEFPQLEISRPRLWWPNGYGDAELYELQLLASRDGAPADDEQRVRFGIREIQSELTAVGRIFRVNGRRIFLRGGNWVGTDMLLRLSPKRYFDEIQLHRDMGLNMIRVWGGALAERPEFYAACDELGMLVMQDFWITGDCNGAWPDASKREQQVRRRYPDDHQLFLACARDTIRLLRNHPSLCFWCGGNEVPPWGCGPGESEPPADLERALSRYIGAHEQALDPTRIYVSASADAEYVDFDGDGLHGHGPYGYMEPEEYPPLARGFTTEIGTVAIPPAESLKEMLPEEDWWPHGAPGWGTPSWRYHNEQNATEYGFAISQYGTPADLDEFALQAQLVNYKSYQGIFEAWNARMWRQTSGLLIWKSQNCWPNLRSQIYDWYLEPTAGFFATAQACAPISILLDQSSWEVGVCNTTATPLAGYSAAATFFGLDGRCAPTHRVTVEAAADAHTGLFHLRRPRGLGSVYFLRLELRDGTDSLCARNVYWFSSRGTRHRHRYAALGELRRSAPPVALAVETQPSTGSNLGARRQKRRAGSAGMDAERNQAERPASSQDAPTAFHHTIAPVRETRTVVLRNPTPRIAFFVRLKLLQADAQTRVLPTFYGDNYLTLFPGETARVDVGWSVLDVAPGTPRLFLEGWNALPMEIP